MLCAVGQTLSPRGMMRQMHVSYYWHQVRERAGLDDVRIHDLSHTFASHAVLQRVQLPVVSRLLSFKHPSGRSDSLMSATGRPRRPRSA